MVKDVCKINVDAYNYRYPMQYFWTYVFVRTYKRRTMGTIVSKTIGRVFSTYNLHIKTRTMESTLYKALPFLCIKICFLN